MELRLAHCPLQAEQQPVVEGGRLIDAILVEDQRAAQGAQLDEAVPIGRVAGQSGDLQAHDDAGPAQGNLADEALEAVARGRACTGFAEVVVDHMDPFGRPARRHGAIAQSILTLGALNVLGDLAQGRLADVEIGIAGQVVGGDLEIRQVHECHLSSKRR